MGIKYWEYEDAPLKEKIKNPKVSDIARIFFDNENEAYRFASLLLLAKKTGGLRLKDVPKNIPVATAKRYLDYAVQIGLLKHESTVYEITDRYTKPMRNIAAYIKAWSESQNDEDLAMEFVTASRDRQIKRGGRQQKQDQPATE
ncbi:hypothetical protein M1373_03295 [Candidatus Marsarchaeota archaeon]|nr:hypothetical protein [Candidatus Marsarchaeota archaeon]MCL5404771.1 hypothetical protein [Candidatus Marsarchaeota archaeon]